MTQTSRSGIPAHHRTALTGRRRKMLPSAVAAAAGLGVALLPLAGPAAAAEPSSPVSYQAALAPIVANKVAGTGAAWVTLESDQALVQIQVQGLLDGAAHAQHIHIGAQGTCPTQGQPHSGSLSVSVADGAPFYGSIGTSLTLTGDTGPGSALQIDDFPATGAYTYVRTVPLGPDVRSALADGTAVLVVHGIDYNGNGSYDDVLGASELDPTLPAEATDPALCGRFEPMQMSGVPVGSADTGGGSTAAQSTGTVTKPDSARTLWGVLVAGATVAGWVTVSRTIGRWITRPGR